MPYAIVTGASQGIGKAIAEKLLQEGFSIAVCARNHTKLQAAAQEWQKNYPAAEILALPADMSQKEDVKAFAAAALATYPHIDLLVNNAGMFLPGSLGEEPEGLLERMISINLYSAYNLTRAILPNMTTGGNRHIFNLCSVASLRAYPNGGSYSVSKYALLGFSDNLREELKNTNIKVTAICPGATYTPSWEGSGVEASRIMEAKDVADMLWAAWCMAPQTCVETIIMKPQKGDL